MGRDINLLKTSTQCGVCYFTPRGHYITNPTNPLLKGRNPSNLPCICSVSFPLNGSHLMITAKVLKNQGLNSKKKRKAPQTSGMRVIIAAPFCCLKHVARNGGFLTKRASKQHNIPMLPTFWGRIWSGFPWSPWIFGE